MRISELGNVGLGQIPEVAVSRAMVDQIQPLTVAERARITTADAGPRFDLDAGVNEDLAGFGEYPDDGRDLSTVTWLDQLRVHWGWLALGAALGISVLLVVQRRRKTRPVAAIPTYPISEVD